MSVSKLPELVKIIDIKKIVGASKAIWRRSYDRIFSTLRNGGRTAAPILTLTLILLLAGCTMPFKKGKEDTYVPVIFKTSMPTQSEKPPDELLHPVAPTEPRRNDESKRLVTPAKPQTRDESENAPVEDKETVPSDGIKESKEDWLSNLTPQDIKDIAAKSTRFTPEELSRLKIHNWEFFGSVDAPARAKDIDVLPVQDKDENTVGYLVLWISNDNVSKEWYEQHPNGAEIPDKLLAGAPIDVAVLSREGIVEALSNDMPDDIREEFLDNPELIRGYIEHGYGSVQITCDDYTVCGMNDSGLAPATKLLMFKNSTWVDLLGEGYSYFRNAIEKLSKQGVKSGRSRAARRLKKLSRGLT